MRNVKAKRKGGSHARRGITFKWADVVRIEDRVSVGGRPYEAEILSCGHERRIKSDDGVITRRQCRKPHA